MSTDEELMPVPIPALCILFAHLEKKKGAPLSRAEVLAARDSADCIMLPLSIKRRMDVARGYADLDPENAWQDWLAFRKWAADRAA
jgi:hypothetical protein